MPALDYLWLFFILAALQPVLRKKMLQYQRAALIARLHKQHDSRVILLVHRQETMSFLGFPIVRYIDMQDSEEVLHAIHLTDDEVPLDIVLHTPGGLVIAAVQIARAIMAHKGRVTVYVPDYAMSGGTLIALAADKIVMSPHAVLGPVDPQLGEFPAASILKAVARKPIEKVDDETLIRADIGKKALAQVLKSATELLRRHMDSDKAAKLGKLLASGTWTHDYPISAEEALAMGLPISTDMPEDILKLMRLYPQPVRRQGGVEYLPIPRRKSSSD